MSEPTDELQVPAYAAEVVEHLRAEGADRLLKKLSFHDIRQITKSLRDELARMNGLYVDAINGRREFRQAYREALEKLRELSKEPPE